MSIHVVSASVDDPGMVDLLTTHLATMHAVTPAGFVFALDLDGLRGDGVRLFALRDGDELIGCGAIARIDEYHGELKSMHVRAARRGQGLAGRLLTALEADARTRGVTRLSLETGDNDEFAAAHALYERHGYEPCPPFGSYTDNGHSAFFSKRLGGPLDRRPA